MKHILALIGLLTVVTLPAGAQTPTPPAAPNSVITPGAVPPERLNGEIDDLARKQQERGGAVSARFRHFHLAWAGNAGEFAALAKHAVMLLVVLSQKSEELPLARLYIQAGGRDVPVQKLSSWRSEIDSGRLAYKLFGRYREDGFYLLPAGPLMRDGVLLTDFAANRVGMGVVQLPTAKGTELAKKFPDADPAPGAKPDAKALKAFIQRWYPGFPVQ